MIFSLNDVERFAVFALTFEGGCTASANRAEEGSPPGARAVKATLSNRPTRRQGTDDWLASEETFDLDMRLRWIDEAKAADHSIEQVRFFDGRQMTAFRNQLER